MTYNYLPHQSHILKYSMTRRFLKGIFQLEFNHDVQNYRQSSDSIVFVKTVETIDSTRIRRNENESQNWKFLLSTTMQKVSNLGLPNRFLHYYTQYERILKGN